MVGDFHQNKATELTFSPPHEWPNLIYPHKRQWQNMLCITIFVYAAFNIIKKDYWCYKNSSSAKRLTWKQQFYVYYTLGQIYV